METRLIACKLIDVPKVSGDVRTFSKEFAVKLADSIKIDGQISPIVVRPNPADKDRFVLVAGKHRLYGIKNVLKEQLVNATILLDMDEAEAAIVSDVENLWRNPLNKAQHAAAVKRWHTHWLAKLPPIEPKSVAESAITEPVAGDAVASDQTDQKALDSSPVATVAEAASEAQFNETVAAVTGQSAATVRRSKAIANAFTAEQLEVFVQMDVNQTDMMTIAKIKDEGQRAEVVNLVASGMVVEDAIKEIMKDQAPSKYNNKTAGAAAAEAKKATEGERAPELTDDEWFDADCGEKAAMLGDPAKFKSDALLFRQHSELRHAYRSKGKKSLAETKKTGITGAFFNLVNRVLSIAHPKDWLICPGCFGKGTVASGASEAEVAKFGEGYASKNCTKCFGGGYLLKTEEYL
jgi:ParB-like chromosome segregation protein Spo0J